VSVRHCDNSHNSQASCRSTSSAQIKGECLEVWHSKRRKWVLIEMVGDLKAVVDRIMSRPVAPISSLVHDGKGQPLSYWNLSRLWEQARKAEQKACVVAGKEFRDCRCATSDRSRRRTPSPLRTGAAGSATRIRARRRSTMSAAALPSPAGCRGRRTAAKMPTQGSVASQNNLWKAVIFAFADSSIAEGWNPMTELLVTLPDDLAKQARERGLLSDEAIRSLLEEALRRSAGQEFLKVADRLHAANIPPMSEDEVVALVKQVRAERRARDAGRS
jgi:hypothetical protein